MKILYIGETVRPLNKRCEEHVKAFLHDEIDSYFTDHLCGENHDFNTNVEILHVEKT